MPLPDAPCTACGQKVSLRVEAGRVVGSPCKCRGARAAGSTERSGSPGTSPAPRAPEFSNAKPTDCAGGHRHASKMEARVCARLMGEVVEPFHYLVQQIRLPLLILRGADGRVPYITIDFAVVRQDHTIANLIDAKAKGRVSRDWPARKRACELSWGVTIQECDR